MLDAFRTVDCSLHLPRFEPDRPVSIGSDAWFRRLCGAWRAVPAAHVRARLRYEKLVRAAAEEISNKNRYTLKRMVADE